MNIYSYCIYNSINFLHYALYNVHMNKQKMKIEKDKKKNEANLKN